MTEFSWPWQCSDVGDGGSASYSLDVVRMTNSVAGNLNQTTSGVVYWTDTTILPFTSFATASDGLLLPSNPSGNTVRIASGIGIVQGWMYASDGNTDFDVSTAPINSTNLVVLRRDASAQTVRLAYKVAGAPAGTATVTQTAATWEVAIATVAVDGSSNLSTLTDSRNFAISPMAGMVKLREFTGDGTADVDWTDIQQDLTHLRIVGSFVSWSSMAGQLLTISFNGSAGTNYSYLSTTLDSTGISASAVSVTAASILLGNIHERGISMDDDGDIVVIDIPNYSSSTLEKAVNGDLSSRLSLLTTGIEKTTTSGFWRSTAAITRIQIGGGLFNTGSVFTLYGLR